MTRRVIFDTDPGQDDAIALLLALASPAEITVEAIVAVAGNVPVSLTAKNARKICELAGRPDIPVYAGCAGPMAARPLVTAEHVHGATGLNGPDLPEPSMPLQPEHGVDFLINYLRREAPGEITLCVLGPMTNIAMALKKAPDIAPRIREIVAMGGAYFEVGNITPTAEFNIYVDPGAAAIVLASGIPIVMLPLDVTHRVLTTPERLGRIRALHTKAAAATADMLDFSEKFDLDKYGSTGAPLHDPCVTAYLLKPDLFQGRHINVEIETASPLCIGMTVADYWRVTDRPANALYIRDVDTPGFYDLLAERLARLP
ncbi:MAG TPA: nucleoside hydrolase [Acidisoma sp.]|jgi:purine nucleosidase|nr:nucleoside hydrolase [Acidisoma sp.]